MATIHIQICDVLSPGAGFRSFSATPADTCCMDSRFREHRKVTVVLTVMPD
jgi:hypothetical protein